MLVDMKNKHLMWLFRSTVSLLILFYFFHLVEIDRGRILSIFSNLLIAQLAIAFFFLCCTVLFQIWRWHIVTKSLGCEVGINSIINIFFSATFSGLILPSSLGGDAIRMLLLKQYGLSSRQAMVSVGMDRIAGLLSLLFLVLIVHTVFYFNGVRSPIIVSGLLLSMFIWCGIVLVLFCLRYEHKFARWPLANFAFSLLGDFKTVNFRRYPGLATGLLSLAIQLFCSVSIYFIARALQLPISLWVTVALVPVVMLATAIPISVAGWGVREGAMVLAFAVVGVSAEDALMTSLVFGALMTLVGFVCGMMWLANFHWEILFDRRNFTFGGFKN